MRRYGAADPCHLPRLGERKKIYAFRSWEKRRFTTYSLEGSEVGGCDLFLDLPPCRRELPSNANTLNNSPGATNSSPTWGLSSHPSIFDGSTDTTRAERLPQRTLGVPLIGHARGSVGEMRHRFGRFPLTQNALANVIMPEPSLEYQYCTESPNPMS